MERSSILFGVLALMGLLFVGTPAGQALPLQPQVDSNIAGMDHSKLNHGVPGLVAYKADEDLRANFESDPNVFGTDHSKLNHGVPGVGFATVGSTENAAKVVSGTNSQASKIPPLANWAPPAEIADKVAAAALASMGSDREAIKAVADAASPASNMATASEWAPPMEIADKVAAAARRAIASASIRNQ